MKRITSFFLVLVMALLLIPSVPGFAAFAESVTAEMDYVNGNIIVKGNIGEDASKQVSVAVLKYGVTAGTFSSIADILVIDEVASANDGSYIYKDALMPAGSSTGDYTVVIAVDGRSDIKSTTFYYADTTAMQAAVAAVNAMDITTARAVFVDGGNAATNNAKTIGVDVTGDYLNYTDAVNAALIKLRPAGGYANADAASSAASIMAIRDNFKEALWIGTMARISAVSSAELRAESEARLIDLSVDNYKSQDYLANKDTVWTNFLAMRAGKAMDTKADVQTAFDEALTFTMINGATLDNVCSAIKNYDADVLKFSVNYPDEMSFFESNDLEVAKVLFATSYSNINEFKSAFVNAVAAVKADMEEEAEEENNYYSGGGGGGGSITISEKPPVVEPEKPDYTKIYTDIKGHWAVDHISTLVEKGVMNGYGDSTIRPDGIITREEFLKMVIDALGYSKGGAAADLNDVNQSAWYAPYINTAVSLGISTGKGDGTFGIGETIKRQDMAVLACRALENLGVSLNGGATAFTDNANIDNYAAESVAKLVAANIISGRGDGSFCPNDYATRAEAAKIICGVMSQRGEGVK